jgi:ribosomal protein L19
MTNLIEKLRIEALGSIKKKNTSINAGDIVSIITSQYTNTKKKQVVKGVCIAKRRRNGSTRIRIRNIIAGEPVEQTYIVESPIISQLDVIGKTKGTKATKYYIRNRSQSESKI